MSRVVIITGTQSFEDFDLVEKSLLKYLKDHCLEIDEVEIVASSAPGANKIGEVLAEKYHLPLSKFYEIPEAYGVAAAWVRNEQMAEYAEDRNGLVLAFWDGKSEETKSMLRLAKKHNLEVHTVLYEGKPISPKTALDINAVFGLQGEGGVVDNLNDLYDLDPSIRSN